MNELTEAVLFWVLVYNSSLNSCYGFDKKRNCIMIRFAAY